MNSFTETEKAPTQPPQLHLKTPKVHEKPSSDTLASENQALSSEKHNGVTTDASRRSDVSSPRSNHQNPFDTDIEAMITPSQEPATRATTNMTVKCGGPDCQVWPGRDHWKQKAKAAKIKHGKRGCNCMGHLTRKQRIMVNCAIVLVFLAIALGVGIGISKALGAKY